MVEHAVSRCRLQVLRLRGEVQHGSAELEHLRKLVTLCAGALAGNAEQKELLAAELAVQQQVRAAWRRS